MSGTTSFKKGGSEPLKDSQTSLADKCELDLVSNDALNLPPIPGVRHLRGVSHDTPEWFSVFENADLFVLPTREDCLGLAVIEAMTAGLPVIGTSVMSVPELVQEGRNGFCVPVRNVPALSGAIFRLYAERELRFRLGAESRALAEENFNCQVNGNRLADVYRKAAESGGSQPSHQAA